MGYEVGEGLNFYVDMKEGKKKGLAIIGDIFRFRIELIGNIN